MAECLSPHLISFQYVYNTFYAHTQQATGSYWEKIYIYSRHNLTKWVVNIEIISQQLSISWPDRMAHPSIQ